MANEKQFIQGEDIVVKVDTKMTLHATQHSLNIDLAMKDVRTKNTNGLEKSPGDISWGVDGDGLVCIDSSITDAMNTDAVISALLSKKEVVVAISSPISGALKTYTGNAYFTKVSLSSQAGENATYNYSLVGSGDLTPSTPSTPPTP